MDTIVCPNRLCGKEVSVEFSKCPFCGTSLDPESIKEFREKREQSTKVKITTTNSIENYEIVEYFPVITSNAVISSNIIKEFFVGFRTVVGGFSGKYKEMLDSAYQTALDLLKDHARRLQANAIVGLKVDFGNISSDVSSNMFMIGNSCKNPSFTEL